MLKNKLLHLIARVSLGRELATALTLLRLLLEAIEKRNTRNVALFVFKQLPEGWKHPKGPATEAEFTDTIAAGETFLRKVRDLVNK